MATTGEGMVGPESLMCLCSLDPLNGDAKWFLVCEDVQVASMTECRLLAIVKLISSCLVVIWEFWVKVMLFHQVPASKDEYAVEMLGKELRLRAIEYDGGWHLCSDAALAIWLWTLNA